MSATYARVPLPPDAAMADAIEAWLARECDQDPYAFWLVHESEGLIRWDLGVSK